MNGIADNEFSQRWKAMAKETPVPKAVLVTPAHWLSEGKKITAMDFPKKPFMIPEDLRRNYLMCITRTKGSLTQIQLQGSIHRYVLSF